MGAAIQHRCWNHEAREASCRCPECSRSFCRECVTEHESRLLCAACLEKLTAARSRKGRTGTRLAPAALLIAGIAMGWLLFYSAGQALLATGEQSPASEVSAGKTGGATTGTSR